MSSTGRVETTAAKIILRYLNFQLAENYATASDWFDLYGEASGDTEYDVERSNLYAWIRYHHRLRGTNGDILEFSFSEPKLTFICDHDALLHVGIRSLSHKSQDGLTTSVPIEGATMSYRVATTYRSIVGNDVKVGDHESRIRILVCDFDNAVFVSSRGVADDTLRRDMGRYLLSYLKVLQSGGHHALFFPPEFAEDDKRPDIHFSLTGDFEDRVPLDHIFGCTAEMINGYLSLLWYTCAFIARERSQHGRPTWDRSSALAGYSSWLVPEWSTAWHMSLKFGEPKVTILCSREVILRFTLTEVRFYDASQLSVGSIVEKAEPDYQDWVIAVIIDISASKTGISVRPASARYSEEFTHYGGVRDEHDVASKLLTTFFVERYFQLMAATRLKHLFRRIQTEYLNVDSSSLDIDGSWWMLERNAGLGARILNSNVKDTRMEGFDVVIAVSQMSINSQILRVFKTYHEMRWAQDQDLGYHIEIKAVTVCLVNSEEASETDEISATGGSVDSDDEATLDGTTATHSRNSISCAIVTVHVTEAVLQTMVTANLNLTRTDEPYTFQDCQLAYEVNVRDCVHRKLEHPVHGARPYPDPPPQAEADYDLRHIYLDLRTAQFSPEYSPWDDGNYSDQEKLRVRMALAQHIKDDYFPQLIAHGVHILASVPIYHAAGGFNRLTDMKYRTFATETIVSGGFNQEESITRSEQILFVLGMVGGNPLPADPFRSFKPSASWLVYGHFSYGTLAISRSAFHDRLLALLARVNALTTLEPVTQKDEGNVHKDGAQRDGVQAEKGRRETARTDGAQRDKAKTTEDVVQRWIDHPERQQHTCKWTPIVADEAMNLDSFEWRSSHERSVREEGSLSSMKREYRIHCTTNNKLELPNISTLSNGSLEIRMSGTLGLEITNTRSAQAWSTESFASWSAAIIIKTSTRGNVEVEIEGLDDIYQSPPSTTSWRAGSNTLPDAHATLRKHLLKKEDFDSVLQELRELQGDWKYYYPASSPFTLCTPTSNPHGDLLFELRRSQPPQMLLKQQIDDPMDPWFHSEP
ncbi:hypothetical protein GSI_15288 [Ganoderma sinense ZZ0214-1]|uniref:Uncharacterized protein n=1 Tax=Ganoderma sinense ZZ0214-1 TaxID=1077348 RepID=A0A2G8RM60_9APHY|nr:hypothetical protein GSI_15288 [Ganoderma sinense ZZ0214-1]